MSEINRNIIFSKDFKAKYYESVNVKIDIYTHTRV